MGGRSQQWREPTKLWATLHAPEIRRNTRASWSHWPRSSRLSSRLTAAGGAHWRTRMRFHPLRPRELACTCLGLPPWSQRRAPEQRIWRGGGQGLGMSQSAVANWVGGCGDRQAGLLSAWRSFTAGEFQFEYDIGLLRRGFPSRGQRDGEAVAGCLSSIRSMARRHALWDTSISVLQGRDSQMLSLQRRSPPLLRGLQRREAAPPRYTPRRAPSLPVSINRRRISGGAPKMKLVSFTHQPR